MRVARLIERLPPALGGKEVHGAELSRALRGHNLSQHVFCRSGDPLGDGIRQTWVQPGAVGQAHSLAGFCVAAAVAIDREHARLPFDLVHVHGDFLEAAAGAGLSRRLGIPAVLTVHGGLSERRSHDLLRLGTFSSMQKVLVVSADLERDLHELGVSAPIKVMPSGVRGAFFESGAERRDPRTVVFVGRLAEVKGIDTLRAARDLMAPGRNLRWVIAAGGDGSEADRLRQEISRRPDMECIVERDPKRLAHLLRTAAVFVLPSVSLAGQREGVPTALLEAVACGTPIVATDTGGVGAVLGQGRGGLLVPPADPDRLAGAIAEALDHPDLAAQRAEVARKEGWARPWPDVAADIHLTYQSACDRFAKPTVVFALPWFDVGGAEHIILTLVRGFSNGDVVPCVAAAPGLLTRELVPPAEFAPMRRVRGPTDAIRNLVAMAGVVIRTHPTAINSHHLPTGLIARAAATLSASKARHALTIHMVENPRMIPVAGFVGAYAFDKVLPVAESVRQEISRFAPTARRRRFSVVYAGVDIPPEPSSVARTVGVLARFVPRKGHRVILEVWERVKRDARAAGWELELWGDGPERESLERLARSLGIDSSVRFRGPVRNAAMRIGELSVVALPSFREGLPLVLIEAMAAGCPIVCSDLPGCRELLGERVGLRVSPGDVEGFKEALLAFIANADLRAEHAELGRRRAREKFSKGRQYERYRQELGIA